MNDARFTSWQIVRIRGAGPYCGSAWRIAAHVYRERALNLADAVAGLQRDLHVWDEAYGDIEAELAAFRALWPCRSCGGLFAPPERAGGQCESCMALQSIREVAAMMARGNE